MFLIILWQPTNFVIDKVRGTRWIHSFDNRLIGLCGIIIYIGLKNDKDIIEEDTMNTFEWRNTQLRPRFVLLEITVPVGVDHSYPLHVTQYLYFSTDQYAKSSSAEILFVFVLTSPCSLRFPDFYPLINYDKSSFTWRFYLCI